MKNETLVEGPEEESCARQYGRKSKNYVRQNG